MPIFKKFLKKVKALFRKKPLRKRKRKLKRKLKRELSGSSRTKKRRVVKRMVRRTVKKNKTAAKRKIPKKRVAKGTAVKKKTATSKKNKKGPAKKKAGGQTSVSKPGKQRLEKKSDKSAHAKPVIKKKGSVKAALPNHLAGSAPAVTAEREQKLAGIVTHYFSRIQVVVIKVIAGKLLVGDVIGIRGKSVQFKQRIESMQIESVNVKVARKGQLIGLKVKQEAKPGDKVYLLS